MSPRDTDFSDPALLDRLDGASGPDLDELDFGVIRMDSSGMVTDYNRYESQAAGLSRERVLGRHFFTEVGPCTQNHQISEPMLRESALDIELDYVFTFRMKLTPVRLRLLKRPTSAFMYLLVRS
jgi:photoactive yellow protein